MTTKSKKVPRKKITEKERRDLLGITLETFSGKSLHASVLASGRWDEIIESE
jgi:hypothetical protein